jgi:maltooligosyltrehalose trehalohydrolase
MRPETEASPESKTTLTWTEEADSTRKRELARTTIPIRRLPMGAELQPNGDVHFRLWAPRHRHVSVILEQGPGSPRTVRMEPETGGYWSIAVPFAGAGTRYRYRIEDQACSLPDPASRFQPEGTHQPSEIIDPRHFPWTDSNWSGLRREGQVISEIHIGTFTPEGTWAAAVEKLPHLADVGITCVEVMPVAEFSGRFGWGYDGVHWYAPTRLYGRPDDFRAFVDRAHALGLGVILDVVYNHFGPDGNYCGIFAKDFFTDRHKTDWGAAINYDGPQAQPVRDFVCANAAYWIEEFHLDGLRLDATQNIYDSSKRHILADVAQAARRAAGKRAILLIAENEPQESRLVQPESAGGCGLDALWNDDYHHSASVALTGRNEAYYTDYRGTPQEFISALKYGYLYQGQWYKWQKKRRGTPSLDLPPAAFVTFLENHDQVANSNLGQRLHQVSHPGRYRALTALTLLGPGTPMLFQGQEFASSKPFNYFADHHEELAPLVDKGRRKFLAQFPSFAATQLQDMTPNPAAPETFAGCKLDWSERERNAAMVALHRDLLRLRRDTPAFRTPRQSRVAMDGAVLCLHAFVVRFFHPEGDRLVLVNLGPDIDLSPCPEPLLAPPEGCEWELAWSSEDPRYGGLSLRPPVVDGWHLLGEAAQVLAPCSRPQEGRKES